MTLRAKAGVCTARMVRIRTFFLLAAILHLFTGSVTANYVVEYDEHGNLTLLFNGTSFSDYYYENSTLDYDYGISLYEVPKSENSSEVLHPCHLPFFLALLSLLQFFLQDVRTGF